MVWQGVRIQLAAALLLGCIGLHVYGIMALLLVRYDAYLLLGYMGLSILAIPVFVLVHFLTPSDVRRKKIAEANRRERLFIRLYAMNLRLAGGIWMIIFLLLILKNKA
jgi:hypothetical protein